MMDKHGYLPWPSTEEMTAEQLELHGQITGGKRGAGPQHFQLTAEGGRLEGPFNAMLLNVKVGSALQRLGEAVRFFTTLSDRAREIATLESAKFRGSAFEWYAHECIARATCLSEAELRALRDGKESVTFSDDEVMVRKVVNELLTERGLGESLLREAADVLGDALVNDIIALVGYYDILDVSMRVWRTPLPVSVNTQPVPG